MYGRRDTELSREAGIMYFMQIRAEEVSHVQYMLVLKFSAQGLDKKVCVHTVEPGPSK